jgi:molybdenum cofactor cytidylyltransferase
MLAAVILAAGESSRMGSPKALVPFQGRPFLEHLIEVTRHPKVGVQRVVLGAGAEDIRSKLQLDPASVVVNPEWEEGQLSSIHKAVNSLPPGTDGIMLCLVDHPLITAALVGELISQFYASQKMVVVPTFQGKRGHPVIFSSKLYPELLAAPADKGARAVVWAHATDLLEVPTAEEGVILNLNDPDTMRKAMNRGPDVS